MELASQECCLHSVMFIHYTLLRDLRPSYYILDVKQVSQKCYTN